MGNLDWLTVQLNLNGQQSLAVHQTSGAAPTKTAAEGIRGRNLVELSQAGNRACNRHSAAAHACWMAESSHCWAVPLVGRVNVHTSVTSCGCVRLPETTLPDLTSTTASTIA